jgi:hypothetical protein
MALSGPHLKRCCLTSASATIPNLSMIICANAASTTPATGSKTASAWPPEEAKPGHDQAPETDT